jgi:hypothetical protein
MRAVRVIFEHHSLELDKTLDHNFSVAGAMKEAAHIPTFGRSPQIDEGQKLRRAGLAPDFD